VQRVGDAIDPISAVTKTASAAGRGAGVAVPATVGLLSGTSGQSITNAFQAGREGALAAGQGVRMLNEGQQRLMNSPLMQSEGAQAVRQAAANNPTSDMTVGPLSRARAVGMTERAATEEEEVLQRLNQLLNDSQARIAE
jgi:hypothetical protein